MTQARGWDHMALQPYLHSNLVLVFLAGVFLAVPVVEGAVERVVEHNVQCTALGAIGCTVEGVAEGAAQRAEGTIGFVLVHRVVVLLSLLLPAY